MALLWSEDQTELLNYSLRNFLMALHDIDRFKSRYYYLATPFSRGYRFFDVENQSLQETIINALEILNEQEIDRINVENDGGFPILTIFLETGPTVIIEDYVSGKPLANVKL
ncbi:MAG: hypothetical protein ACW97Z_00470 [Candidatus Hodarchaeales archaeon]|jgi:hypothetical protein